MRDNLRGQDSAGQQPLRERMVSGPVWLYALVGAMFVLVIGLIVFTGGRKQGRAEKYLAELRARGEKLTYQELAGAEFAGTNPAYAAILLSSEDLKGLGFSPGGIVYDSYTEPGRLSVAWKRPAVSESRPGSVMSWEELRDYAREAEQSLQAVRETLKTASPEWGKRTNYLQRPVADFVAIRSIAQWLGVMALSALHEGRLEEALANLEALAAVARANAEDYTLVSAMIRVAVAGLGLSVTWQALQADGWSEAQLERMQQAWSGLDLLEAVESGFAGERAGGIDLWEDARISNGRRMRQRLSSGLGTNTTLTTLFVDYVVYPAYKVTSLEADELFYLQSMERALSDIRDVRAGMPWDPARSLAWHSNRLNQITKRFWLSSLALPNYVKATQTAVRNETSRQLTMTAIGIERYRLRHRSIPPDLEALSPVFLRQPTRDPMSGKPLRYKPGADGGYVLYSVGENGLDDGGDPTPPLGTKPGPWDGRDLAWPVAAD